MSLKREMPSKITSTKGPEKKKMGEDNAPIVTASPSDSSTKKAERSKPKKNKPAQPKQEPKAPSPNQDVAKVESANDTSAVEAEIKETLEREMQNEVAAETAQEPAVEEKAEEPTTSTAPSFGSPPPSPSTSEPDTTEDTDASGDASPFAAQSPEEPKVKEKPPKPTADNADNFQFGSPTMGALLDDGPKEAPLPWEALPEGEAEESTTDVEAEEPKPTWEVPEQSKPAPAVEENNPWLKHTNEAADGAPPELPTSQPTGRDRTKPSGAPKIPNASDLPIPPALLRAGVTLAAIVVVGLAGYLLFFKNNEKTTEMLARWTGAYNEISQEPVQGDEQIQVAVSENAQPEFQPLRVEPVPSFDELEATSPYEEAEQLAVDIDSETEGTRIAILPPAEQADGMGVEPTEQLSMAERLQKALSEARAKRQQEAAVDPNIPTNDPVEQRRRDISRQAELERELAEYRRTLAATTDPTELPKPGGFFRRQRGEQADANAAVYRANPSDLPLVSEPGIALGPQVRTLDSFEVDEFTPPTRKIQIPKGIVPGLQATEFPKLQLLSLVPNRGLIALHDGQRGILLIGDTIQGWELTAVYAGYAEFQNRGRKYTMSLESEIQIEG